MVFVGVVAIRLFYDRDCSGDIVLPMGGLVMARDRPYIVLDCDDTHMDITHLVVVMTSYHHRDEDETAVVVHFQNPQYDVPDCDNTRDDKTMESCRLVGKTYSVKTKRESWVRVE